MVATKQSVDDLFEEIKLQMYLPTDIQILCLECIRPQRIHDVAWRYELRGYIKAMVASGVVSSRTMIWLEENLFGEQKLA